MAGIKKKNVLILGANGFIGKNLTESLNPEKYLLFSPSHFELDVLNPEKLEKFIKRHKIEAAIFAVNIGGGRDTINYSNVLEQNLRMFFNIARIAKMLEKVIFLGSGAVYSKGRNIKNIHEENIDLYIPRDEYGFYKYVVSKYIEKSENIIDLRLFGVYGKYENYLFKYISNTIVKNLLKLPIKIKQNVFFSYLYIDDLVKTIDYFLTHKNKFNAYNAVPTKKIDLLTVAKMVNDVSDYKSEILIAKKGLNWEYTGNNMRLRSEIPILKFKETKLAVSELFNWYRANRYRLNIKKIKLDPYYKYTKGKE